jgi:hypothetical protein
VPRGTGTTPTPPTASLAALASTRSTAIPLAHGIILEPDAPSTLFATGSDIRLCTVLNGGGVGIGLLNARGNWTAIDTIHGTVPPLRRIRALAGVSRISTQSMLFMVGADHQLHVKRKTGNQSWEDELTLVRDVRLHPFTSLAVTARTNFTIHTFFLNDAGLLTTAFWTGGADWPTFVHRPREDAPSFLPGGSLAAVSPGRDLLVFGVGADLHLRFASFVSGQGWTPPAAAGQPADLIGAHTRLSAVAIDATHVEVAALTDAGQAAVYPFEFSGSTWTAQPRILIADPPALAGAVPVPPAGAVLQPADGFRINPFGDLALVRPATANASVLYCAGLRGGQAKALMRDLAPGGTWQFYV